MNLNLILNELYTDAANLYKSQEYQPTSPGEISKDGNYYLCAASCVAYLGLKRSGLLLSAANFLANIQASNEKHHVIEAFRQLGFSENECISIMHTNDECEPSLRSSIISSYLCCLHQS